MKRCNNRFDCVNFMVYDCCGYDCLDDDDFIVLGRYDQDFDDPDFIGQGHLFFYPKTVN